MVDLDEGPFGGRQAQRLEGFVGAVEDDLVAGNAQRPRLLIFHGRHDLGQRAFLVEHGAHGREIIRLVQPAERHVRVSRGEGLVDLAVAAAQHGLGEDEKRRTVGGDEAFDGLPLDLGADFAGVDGARPELVHGARLDAVEDGLLVGGFHVSALRSG